MTLIVDKLSAVPDIIEEGITVLKWNVRSPIPELPKSLKHLYIEGEVSLNVSLPTSLLTLCSTTLIYLKTIPLTLEVLIIPNVTSIEFGFHDKLKVISCNTANVTKIPKNTEVYINDLVKKLKLNKVLKTIWCDKLDSVDKFPDTVEEVYCKRLRNINFLIPENSIAALRGVSSMQIDFDIINKHLD